MSRVCRPRTGHARGVARVERANEARSVPKRRQADRADAARRNARHGCAEVRIAYAYRRADAVLRCTDVDRGGARAAAGALALTAVQRRVVWSGMTETYEPTSVARDGPAFARVIVGALQQRGLLPAGR